MAYVNYDSNIEKRYCTRRLNFEGDKFFNKTFKPGGSSILPTNMIVKLQYRAKQVLRVSLLLSE